MTYKGSLMVKMSSKSSSHSNTKLNSQLKHQEAQIKNESEIYSYLTIAKELLKEHSRKGH